MVESVEFAKYIITRTQKINETAKEPINLGETKLHKLLYICDGFMLASDINFIKGKARAWNYGPVYPAVHSWISKNPDVFSVNNVQLCKEETLKKIEAINAEALVDKVLIVYGTETAGKLSAWTHKPGSPWEKALKRGKGIMNSPIDKIDMSNYFRRLLE